MQKIAKVLLPVLLISFILIGCGSGVNEDKPISEVKTEAQTMSVDQLKSVVAQYDKVIESKRAEIEQLAAKLKDIPIAQMMGEEAKKLKSDIQDVSSSVKALTDRLNIYAQELKSKM